MCARLLAPSDTLKLEFERVLHKKIPLPLVSRIWARFKFGLNPEGDSTIKKF